MNYRKKFLIDYRCIDCLFWKGDQPADHPLRATFNYSGCKKICVVIVYGQKHAYSNR